MIVRVVNCAAGDFDLLETNSADPNVAFGNAEAVCAVVVGETTAGDDNAHVLGGTPDGSSGAQTLAGGAVMVKRAGGGDVVTSVGQRAPGGSFIEAQALSAVVVSGTTRWDLNARVVERAPGLAGRADAVVGGAVVVERTVLVDGVTRVSGSAPGPSGEEGQTVSAVVGGSAAEGNSDASQLSVAPGLSEGADAKVG